MFTKRVFESIHLRAGHDDTVDGSEIPNNHLGCIQNLSK